jgi:SHS2 domain-containing protein
MSPFREIDHTADWALEVWAPTLEQLFVDAARGMYQLAGAVPDASQRQQRRLTLTAGDTESLLVSWLQELLYVTESEGLAFDEFHVASLSPQRLEAEAAGGPATALEKVIKAVTYHNLAIRASEAGYSVTIVFDV